MLPQINTFYERLVYAKNVTYPNTPWSDIAAATGISRANFSRYKKGDYFPSPVTLLKLAHLFGISASWLAGEEIDLSDSGLCLLTSIYKSIDDYGRDLILEYALQTYNTKRREDESDSS